jgi:two-component system, NtrC family, response regulator PilR
LLNRWGYDVTTMTNAKDALELVKTSDKEFGVAILDDRMKDMAGSELALSIREFNKETSILMYSAHPSIEALTNSIRARSLNFITKSENINELRTEVAKACAEFEKVRTIRPPLSSSEVVKLIESVGMRGQSQKLGRVAEKILKYRASKKTVLILGETGVGKEKVARALHSGSDDSFFVVNCATLQDNNLFESELFGHEKGSFTGANTRKIGIFEAARGGTVYLDEVQHLDLKSHGKLLRAIREKKIRRLGGIREEPVDFRLIVSAWPDIEQRSKDGTFLPDLYYRLKFLCIEVPALRERVEDIEPLVHFFCEKHLKETGERKTVLQSAIRNLEAYNWPGNIGELDGYVSALLADSTGTTVGGGQIDEDLRLKTSASTPSTIAQIDARSDNDKRQAIRYALDISKSARQAARVLGIQHTSLQALMNRLEISADSSPEVSS